jgi:DNA-binding CsgD family transcriptional regulator
MTLSRYSGTFAAFMEGEGKFLAADHARANESGLCPSPDEPFQKIRNPDGGGRGVPPMDRRRIIFTGCAPGDFGESHLAFESVEAMPRLTRREYEILPLILARKRDKEIAAALGISIRTVEKHIEHLRRKFAAASRREIARRVRSGFDGDKIRSGR